MTYKDTTFCVSPNCEDKCGRKIPEIPKDWKWGVSVGYFCGEPEDDKDNMFKGKKR